jgi:hypothetical protein
MRSWVLVLITAGTVTQHAFEVSLDPQVVVDAVALGQSAGGAARDQFHQRYRFVVARPPLDAVDIVTPFRRVVIAAELRARAGDRRFGQREALGVLAQAPQQVSVHLDLTFHPQNVLVLVPRYQVYWETAGRDRVEPIAVDSRPRYFPRTSDSLPVPLDQAERDTPPALPGRSVPMLGASVVARFDGAGLKGKEAERADALIVAEADGTVLTRLRVNLDGLR